MRAGRSSDISRAGAPARVLREPSGIVKRKLMRRQAYTFKLRDVEHGPDLARFFAAHLKRPVVGFQANSTQGDVDELPAYHRHRFGGCHGTLRIDGLGIQFASDRAQDSRTWSYSEIETVGTMNAFHFRVSTLNETYNFELKERLRPAASDLSFKSVTGQGSRRSGGVAVGLNPGDGLWIAAGSL